MAQVARRGVLSGIRYSFRIETVGGKTMCYMSDLQYIY